MPRGLQLTPALHGPAGHALPHDAVRDEVGETFWRACDVIAVRRGTDYLSVTTSWAIRDDPGAPLVILTVKLTLDGCYVAERGHVDDSASLAVYRVDAQVSGLPFDQLPVILPALLAGAVRDDLARVGRPA